MSWEDVEPKVRGGRAEMQRRFTSRAATQHTRTSVFTSVKSSNPGRLYFFVWFPFYFISFEKNKNKHLQLLSGAFYASSGEKQAQSRVVNMKTNKSAGWKDFLLPRIPGKKI